MLLDESGFMLSPTVRRTYAPRGETPILDCRDRRDRISAISAITVSPVRKRPGLIFRLLPDDRNARGGDTVDFLEQLRWHLPGAMAILRDRSNIHSRSRAVRSYLADHPEIVAEDFPGYAPELNPDEGMWGHTKSHRLANATPDDVGELRRLVSGKLRELGRRPDLLASFIHHAGMPIEV